MDDEKQNTEQPYFDQIFARSFAQLVCLFNKIELTQKQRIRYSKLYFKYILLTEGYVFEVKAMLEMLDFFVTKRMSIQARGVTAILNKKYAKLGIRKFWSYEREENFEACSFLLPFYKDDSIENIEKFEYDVKLYEQKEYQNLIVDAFKTLKFTEKEATEFYDNVVNQWNELMNVVV